MPPHSALEARSASGGHGARSGRSLHQLIAWFARVAGGSDRARVVVLLAVVLGLDTADLGSLGATAGQLEHALSLSNTRLGLLAAIPAVCSAVLTVPMGVLADRIPRVRVLWITMLAWSACELVSGFSQSFGMLLLVRVGLGAATAAATPMVASLVGDLFPAAERGKIWGLILSGELIGSAFGYVIAGEAASFGPGSWRFAFFVLVVPSLAGALAVRRWLPEPVRGRRGQLRRETAKPRRADGRAPRAETAPGGSEFDQSEAQQAVEQQEVAPVRTLVLHRDPESMSLSQAMRYVLRIPTNRVLIVASALGYFYFTGLTTFGLVYFQGRYHLAHATATILLALLGLGGLVGVLGGGRLADWWLARGSVNSRIVVGAAAFGVAALLLLPGLLAPNAVVALLFLSLAAIAFGARNPPLDAARLDIMHHRLWGRAEAVRTLLRRTMTATAPIIFGLLADGLAPNHLRAGASGAQGFGANANAHGLKLAFLVLLITLALGGILTVIATRTYPRDMATALASEAATAGTAS
jgi:MFS family permease